MKIQPIKDPEYIAYIESLPCTVCGHISGGNRKIYNEYLDKYTYKPCKNTAHHVDIKMTRTKNDHRVLPMCSHYVVSGKGTNDCHLMEHSSGGNKSKEYRQAQVELADKYYQEFCNLNDIEAGVAPEDSWEFENEDL